MTFYRSVFLPRVDDEIVGTFSRSDIYYNRDVEKLAIHFEEKNNARRPSIQAMNLYRKSVSGICSKDNDFGRRMSILSVESTITEKRSSIGSPAKTVALKLLPGQPMLKNPKLHLFLLHGFVHFIMLFIPFQFLPSQMLSVGLSQKVASRVVSIMAFGGLIGRLTCGFLMDNPKIGVMRAYIASQLLLGIAICCFQFCTTEECAIDLRNFYVRNSLLVILIQKDSNCSITKNQKSRADQF